MLRTVSLLSILVLASLFVFNSPSLAQWVQTNGPWNDVLTFGGDFGSLASLGNTIFASSPNAGIVRSTDNGQTWSASDNGLGILPWLIPGIDFLTAENGTVYAVTGNSLYYSADTGGSWKYYVLPIAVNNAVVSGGNIIIGATGSTVISTDTGKTWITISPIFATSFVEQNGTLFASSYTNTGIYSSTDHGLNWSSSNTLQYVQTMAANNGTLFAATSSAVYRSVDNGSTWSMIDTGNRIYGFAFKDGNVYENSITAIFLSTDNGDTWTPCADIGISKQSINTILSANGNLFAATRTGGVFVSGDNGGHWQNSNPISLVPAYINGIDTVGSRILACTNGGIFYSIDSGADWTADTSGIANDSIVDVAQNSGVILAATNGEGIFRSIDGGATWSPADSGITNFYFSGITVHDGIFYALWTRGIFISTDNGVSWMNPIYKNESVGGYAILSTEKNILVGSFDGIFYSSNNGQDWSEVQQIPSYSTVTSFAQLGNIFYAGTEGSGVWRSTDSGTSWDTAGQDISALNVTSILASGRTLFIGTDTGVFRSIDSGQTWVMIDSGFPTKSPIISLTVKDSIVYAATNNSGIWHHSLKQTVQSPPASAAERYESPKAVTAFPNPLTHSTTLDFTAAESGYATVTIVNQLGVEVARVFAGEIAAGEHSFQWNVPAGIPLGAYECVLRLNGHVQEVPLLKE